MIVHDLISSPNVQPPQPGQDSSGSSSRLEQAGSGSSARLEHDSVVQQNGGHVQPQAWPAAVSQSTAGAPVFRSWRHQKKRRGAAPPDPEASAGTLLPPCDYGILACALNLQALHNLLLNERPDLCENLKK